MNEQKYVHLCNETIEKALKIKNGNIWLYLISCNKPINLEQIINHTSLDTKKVTIALKKLISINAVQELIIDGVNNYQANKETYHFSN